ncbi:MAG: hypothetical protein AB7O88_15430 [Reyranellaceae bacterium]
MKIQNPILNAGLVPLIGASRYLLTLVALVALWWFDARAMNKGFDANLSLIKTVGDALDGSGRVEAALRAFAAEKMLLFAEISAVVWLLGKALWWLIARLFRRRRAASKQATPAAPNPADDIAARLEARSGPSLTISERPTGIRAER